MTRIFVVVRTRLYRDGLGQILDREPHLQVIGVAGEPFESLSLIAKRRPDVVVLDTAMAEPAAAVRDIVRTTPGVRVVAVGVQEREKEIVMLAEAGVAGYVTWEQSLADLVAAVESVVGGETLCSPKIAATLLRRVAVLAGQGLTVADVAPLTLRERQVVRLIDLGLSNQEIARRLCIEISTVKNHVHSILGKLRVRRRAEVPARLRAHQVRLDP
jgi:two-component system, NarL family, nitrate/nitrite response regulator NarL